MSAIADTCRLAWRVGVGRQPRLRRNIHHALAQHIAAKQARTGRGQEARGERLRHGRFARTAEAADRHEAGWLILEELDGEVQISTRVLERVSLE